MSPASRPVDHLGPQPYDERRYLDGRGPRIAVIVSGWPRVSETFALNELIALRRRGLLLAIYATKLGDASLRQPQCDELDDLVHVLTDGTLDEQVAEVVDHLENQVPPRRPSGFHGYFAHRPTAIAAGAARRMRVPYGFSVHALDARKVPADELAAQARNAAIVLACNRDVACTLRHAGATPMLLPHGVDLGRFSSSPPMPRARLELLAVGRLVDKKGFDVLIEAIDLADADLHLRIVGDGPQRPALEHRIAELRLENRVTFVGRRTHEELPACYAGSDVVIVPSVIDARGDRDGLPNVVLEAMACGRPVIASDVSAIPTAVIDGTTGWLVPPGDAAALAAAIDRAAALWGDRRVFGAAGRDRVERCFDLDACSNKFCDELETAYV